MEPSQWLYLGCYEVVQLRRNNPEVKAEYPWYYVNYLIESYQQIKGEYLRLNQMRDRQESYKKLTCFSSYGKLFQAQE